MKYKKKPKIKNYNCPHKGRPHHAYGMCRNCSDRIRYIFDPEYRRRAKERAKRFSKKYYKDPEFRKKKGQREREWRQKNPLAYRKQIALCNIRNILKEGYDAEFIRDVKELLGGSK